LTSIYDFIGNGKDFPYALSDEGYIKLGIGKTTAEAKSSSETAKSNPNSS
jgi:hypothetical protein